MYSVLLSNNNMFNILLEKSNLNLQDINGNNIIHYIIIERNYNFLNQVIEKDIDINVSNIHGKVPLHLLLEDVNSLTSDVNLKFFIKNTNLNIQDNEGNSCFYLLCKQKIWKKAKEYLTEKNKLFIEKQRKFITY